MVSWGVLAGFLSNHFGIIISAVTPVARADALHLDHSLHEGLRRLVDGDEPEPERTREAHRPLEGLYLNDANPGA